MTEIEKMQRYIERTKIRDERDAFCMRSRDVAEMVDCDRKDLLKRIRTYSRYLREGEIVQSDFFIESTYLNAQNHEMPNFLITKKGCDMIANKTTGKKGVLFTAAYVSAFEEMRQALTIPRTPALPDGVTFSSAVGFMRLARRVMLDMGASRVMLDMGASPFDVGMMLKETCKAISFPVPTSLTKQLPGQIGLWDNPLLE